jgi:Na+-transporting NADH:ubiquinone oxidoreductase subunit NqrD
MKRITTSLVLAANLLAAACVHACPDCTLINSGGTFEPRTIASKLAFSFSTLLLLGTVFFVIGFLIWTMVKTCRDLERERALNSPVGEN